MKIGFDIFCVVLIVQCRADGMMMDDGIFNKRQRFELMADTEFEKTFYI